MSGEAVGRPDGPGFDGHIVWVIGAGSGIGAACALTWSRAEGYRTIRPEHIASLIATVIELPTFVDVVRIEVFPTDQATGGGSIVKFDR